MVLSKCLLNTDKCGASDSSLRKPVPVLDHPLSKYIFPYISISVSYICIQYTYEGSTQSRSNSQILKE